MIKEAYVSYEVAELLRDKGFDECTRAVYYVSDKSIHYSTNPSNYNNGLYVSMIAAPTQQMAMAWLRKKYYIHADPIKQGNYNDCSEYYTWIVARMGIIHRNSSVADKLSYEEAVEAALKYVLENLI